MKRSILFCSALLLSLVSLNSCVMEDDSSPAVLAYYRPIYGNPDDLFKVKVQPARMLRDPGRIYLKGSLLIINERFEGFHLIDNSDPAEPKPLMFLEVKGAVNMAMQDQYLYADNVTDLVTIDLSNLQQIQEVNRQKGVFEGNQNYPPFRDVRFECVDTKKGIVVGWEEVEAAMIEADCWR